MSRCSLLGIFDLLHGVAPTQHALVKRVRLALYTGQADG